MTHIDDDFGASFWCLGVMEKHDVPLVFHERKSSALKGLRMFTKY